MIGLHAPEAVLVTVVVFVVAAAHAALASHAARPHRTARAFELRYPPEWRIPGAAFGALAIFAALLVTGRGNPLESAARVVLALLGAGTIFEVFLTRVRVLPDGFERITAWRRPRFFPWAEIASVDLALDPGSLAIRTRSGAQLRIGKRLQGMSAFAAQALIHLPRETLTGDPVLRGWLEERARLAAR